MLPVFQTLFRLFPISSALSCLLALCCLHAQAFNPITDRIRVLVPLAASASFDQALAEVVREFNSKQNRFEVDLSRPGSTFQCLRAIIASHYANDLPDLAVVNEADIKVLQEFAILQPFERAWISKKRFLEHLSHRSKCGAHSNQNCSIPFQRSVAVWYFNQEALFRLKQEPGSIPTDWARLSALSQRLHKPNELWGLGIAGTGETAITRWTALGLKLEESANDAAVDWVKRMWDSQGNWLPGSPSVNEVTKRFMEQRAVILLGALDQWSYFKHNAPFRFGVALSEPQPKWFGTDMVLLSTGKKTAWAREFLDYLYRPEIALRLFKTATTLPVAREYLENSGWKAEIHSNPILKSLSEKRLTPSHLAKIAPQVREEWSAALWQAIEQPTEPSLRAGKTAELRTSLQKILSTNQR
ncbi:MAG: extracellular solute-binding protein [Bdellovibrionota bacterium]